MVLTARGRVRLLKGFVWALCLSPLAMGLHRWFLVDGFGANPIEAIEHFTGDVALIMLLGALSVTPLRRVTGWNGLARVRRLVGLFAFFWVCLHFLAWMGLDQLFEWRWIGSEIRERPYILVGFAAFVMLVPLAVTSTRGWIRRLGRNWTRLHRLVYVATLLGIVHFFWVTRADDTWPFRALAAWCVLMAFRVPWRRLAGAAGARLRPAARAAGAAAPDAPARARTGPEPRGARPRRPPAAPAGDPAA